MTKQILIYISLVAISFLSACSEKEDELNAGYAVTEIPEIVDNNDESDGKFSYGSAVPLKIVASNIELMEPGAESGENPFMTTGELPSEGVTTFLTFPDVRQPRIPETAPYIPEIETIIFEIYDKDSGKYRTMEKMSPYISASEEEIRCLWGRIYAQRDAETPQYRIDFCANLSAHAFRITLHFNLANLVGVLELTQNPLALE